MLVQLFPRNTPLCQVLYICDELLPLYHNPSQNVPYSNSTDPLSNFSSRYLHETNHLYLVQWEFSSFIANIHWATLHTCVNLSAANPIFFFFLYKVDSLLVLRMKRNNCLLLTVMLAEIKASTNDMLSCCVCNIVMFNCDWEYWCLCFVSWVWQIVSTNEVRKQLFCCLLKFIVLSCLKKLIQPLPNSNSEMKYDIFYNHNWQSCIAQEFSFLLITKHKYNKEKKKQSSACLQQHSLRGSYIFFHTVPNTCRRECFKAFRKIWRSKPLQVQEWWLRP